MIPTPNSPNYKVLPHFFPAPPNNSIDLQSICRICKDGLKTDAPAEDRCLAWLAMINIYPSNPNNWPHKREEIAAEYKAFINDFGLNDWNTKVFSLNSDLSNFDVSNPTQMDSIHRDIIRMGHQLCFLPPAKVIPAGCDPNDQLAPFTEHIRRLERILYIFGMINKSFGYMQGFNELLPPIYYVLVTAKHLFADNMEQIEAVAFFCIQQLLTDSDFQKFYTHEDQQKIIDAKLNEFDVMLHQRLPKIAAHFDRLQIRPFCYCYKWVTLLFAQEFDLPEILILWDSIFAHFNAMVRFSFCCAIARLKMTKEQFDHADYKQTMNLLMSPSNFRDINKLIQKANKIFDATAKKRRFSMFPRAH
ncbi:TBC1 domain protein [Tritrichomonas foetus]|uniref:TBC1 domain protein n=1 Tax=Tritrichomonas foetus TaxID=1144522 RepID=A0A1J4KCB6_9EUKA|nr:TBC1 domain protein [Tritrichomonas foetus]|eukprot:OHT07101.1 TBC1 domain protein [Tritrichomonas foetus]